MYPLLASAAASAAGDIISRIADRISQGPKTAGATAAPAVPFATLVDKATATNLPNPAIRSQDLSCQLAKSPEVAAAANEAGVAGPLSIQIDATGASALRLPDGSLKPIQLSDEMRVVARELNQLRQPPATSATMSRPASPVTVNL